METDGGGWTVFQRRMDGSVDFNRNWSDYYLGFGDLTGEFWLGLNMISLLTRTNSRETHELRVDLADYSGTQRYAKFNSFTVGPGYTLTVGGYSGTAGDSLKYHNGMRFSTKDRDNDNCTGQNCAALQSGGWWYKCCSESNLNGKYLDRKKHKFSIGWHKWKVEPLKFTEMKCRLK